MTASPPSSSGSTHSTVMELSDSTVMVKLRGSLGAAGGEEPGACSHRQFTSTCTACRCDGISHSWFRCRKRREEKRGRQGYNRVGIVHENTQIKVKGLECCSGLVYLMLAHTHQPLTTECGTTASSSLGLPHTVVCCHVDSVPCSLSKSCYLVHGFGSSSDVV